MRVLNNKGAVLISVYMVLFVLAALSSSIAMLNISELNEAQRHRDSAAAFWLAEAGIHRYMADDGMLEDNDSAVFTLGEGTVEVMKNDADPRYRVVTAIGIVRGIQRQVQIKYPALSGIFEQTVASKGNLVLEGAKSSVMINDKLRLGGSIVNTARIPLAFFEDTQEGVDEALVSLRYPDANRNGVTDEFDDFIIYNRQLISSYDEEEVLYIQGNETFTIAPDRSLEGKKIIYIEGNRAGMGNAVIQFGGALAEGQQLTVIATGSVTNNQAGVAHKDSQLNVIAWSDYHETAVLPSVHNGIIFTHGKAYFDEIHDTSITNGSVIANEGVVIREVWSTKIFNYADMRTRGAVPPGFERLIAGGRSAYMDRPNSWQEI